MQKISLILILGFVSALTFISCSKDTTSSPLNSNTGSALVQDTVTSFMVYFTNTVDSMTEFGSVEDPDGPGPIQANIGGVGLKKNNTYVVSIEIEDATNPKQIVYIDKQIKSNGPDYKLCLETPLGMSISATDSDGKFPIGLKHIINTNSNTGNDYISFTVKYQKGVKNGDCTPGIVYYTCKLPVSIY